MCQLDIATSGLLSVMVLSEFNPLDAKLPKFKMDERENPDLREGAKIIRKALCLRLL